MNDFDAEINTLPGTADTLGAGGDFESMPGLGCCTMQRIWFDDDLAAAI